jgi:hypothetical protein
MLDIDMKELCIRFEDLIQYFEDLDDYLTNDEIIEDLKFSGLSPIDIIDFVNIPEGE